DFSIGCHLSSYHYHCNSGAHEPAIRSVGAPVGNQDYIPEGDDYSKEQHHQQAPRRRARKPVDNPTDQRAADKTPQQLRQHAVPELVARIRALNLRPVALLFSLARGLKPLLERVDPRVLADGVPFGRVVAHAGLREGVSGTGKELPAEGAAPLERGGARVNRRTHRDANLSRRLSLRRVPRR